MLGLAARTAWAILWANAIVLSARSATAEALNAAPSSAQQLFDEARELMESSQFAEACPKLMASLQLDPATGTLLNLALCYEQQGKFASAYYAYKRAIERSEQEGNLERQQLAEARVVGLESTLSRIAISQPAPVEGLWVTLDGAKLEAEQLSASIPVDLGTHVLEYGAPHKLPVTLTVEVKQPAEKLLIQLQRLQTVPAAKRAPSVALPALASHAQVQRTPWPVAGISFGVAASGAMATAYFGLRAKNEWDERNRLCSPSCTESARQAGQRADQLAWIANVSAGVALLGAGFGTYWLLSKSSAPSRSEAIIWVPTVHRQGAGLAAAVTF
jgi:tetratricopeptide (TPR) repeat protein